jgi:UDP-N-acetylmuramoyl-L-alanyl-D-glutamate--2,6-diaminopimelate ligase
MKKIYKFIKSILGPDLTKKIRPIGHGIKAYLVSVYYLFPSKKLTLIGINGTKGKTTTTVFTAKILNYLGHKTGYISTALIYDGVDQYLNPYKMGTIDSVYMQRILKQMVRNGCTIAVLEMTSEGLAQHRHWGLGKFDISCFLNAYPEHLEAHGGWENYLNCKAKLLLNTDPKGYYLSNLDKDQIEARQHIFDQLPASTQQSIHQLNLTPTKDLKFRSNRSKTNLGLTATSIRGELKTHLISRVEVIDLWFALNITSIIDPTVWDSLDPISEQINGIAGRMEWVFRQGQIQDIVVSSDNLKKLISLKTLETNQQWKSNCDLLVDYAHEPKSMESLMTTLADWRKRKSYAQVIHILSNDGAGRDDWKKPVMGDISYQYANFTVVTTDNFDHSDNPEDILKLQTQNFDKTTLGNKYILEINRKLAFKRALQVAKNYIQSFPDQKVLIVSTGVGTEQGLTQPDGIMNWDERLEWIDSMMSL